MEQYSTNGGDTAARFRIPGRFSEVPIRAHPVASVKRELRLPREKVEDIRKQAKELLKQDKVSARVLDQFLGKLSAAILVVHPALLHYRTVSSTEPCG